MDTNREAIAEEARKTLIDYLVENGVDRTYADIFVRQQLKEFSIYEGAALFPYGKGQYWKNQYDDLGKLLLEASGRGRSKGAARDRASQAAADEMRARVAGAF